MDQLVPSQAPVVNTFFIPKNPRYPYVDLIYYDAKEHVLYVFQITVNLQAHKKSEGKFKAKLKAKWEKLFEKKLKNIQFIWMGGVWRTQEKSDLSKPITPDSWTILYNHFDKSIFTIFQSDEYSYLKEGIGF